MEREISLAGKGLHGGLPSVLRIRRRGDGGGLRFFWPGWTEPLDPRDLGALKHHARRATVLEGREGQKIRSPEHLLAAALFFADDPLDVICDASEPPGLDGSARPFFDGLAEAAPETARSPRWKEYDSDLAWAYEGPEGMLKTSPAGSFSVAYAWDKKPLRERVVLTDAAAAARDVLPARTFILYGDWRAARGEAGLLAGAGADSGLLLAETPEEFAVARRTHPEFRGEEFPLLHPETFRVEQEAARHKILDLLGDLALQGLALPRLRLEIRNGGHALNHLLLERLRHERREHA
jgi:UDP-3-O-[3-hydroxymyristoyl] N-acetylglucosamine deacetylase/3-hydroxyacyl-[acyl-carrier-protein] dehydratase